MTAWKAESSRCMSCVANDKDGEVVFEACRMPSLLLIETTIGLAQEVMCLRHAIQLRDKLTEIIDSIIPVEKRDG